jgi:hypothetical protein
MAIGAGQRDLRVGGFPGLPLAFALTLRGVVNVCSHRPAFRTLDAPVPLPDDYLQLFGRHYDPLAQAWQTGLPPAYDTTFLATRRFHEIVWVTTFALQNNTMSSAH